MEHTHRCPWYLAYYFDNPLRRLFQNPALIVGPYISEGMTAIDLGCGMGYFSLAMARMVGPEGRVISVDAQEKMLKVLEGRAARAGLKERISTVLVEAQELSLPGKADFALAMWMVHEVPDKDGFFFKLAGQLNQGARFLIAEPRMHVSQKELDATIDKVQSTGLKLVSRPKIGLSRSALFQL